MSPSLRLSGSRCTMERRVFSYFAQGQHNWVAAPGEFAILVGSSGEQIDFRGKYWLVPGQENR
jgi:hypothetical protein